MKILKSNIYIYISIFFIGIMYTCFSSDRLPQEYMLYFDNKYYVDIVQNFTQLFHEQNFVSYYNSRLFVPALAFGVLSLLKIPLIYENIETLFTIFNFLSICLAIFYYLKIASLLQFNFQIKLLGFSFLFVNFFVLKLSMYYPILIDIFGFTSGLILLYYYLAKKMTFFYIVLAISMFVFPTTIMIALCLIISSLIKRSNKEMFSLKILKIFQIAIVVVFLLAGSVYSYKMMTNVPRYLHQISTPLLPLAVIISAGFTYFLSMYLMKIANLYTINKKFFKFKRLYITAGIVVLFTLVSKYLSANFTGNNPQNPLLYVYYLFAQNLSFPAKFLISHFAYYGILVPFVIYFRKQLLASLKKIDDFQKLVVLAFLILMLGTETRQILQLFPFFAIFLLNSFKNYKFKFGTILSIFLFQLIWSRFWYTINFNGGFLVDIETGLKLLVYDPAQRFFQFLGPWISTENSFIYALILVATYVAFIFLMKNNNKITSIK